MPKTVLVADDSITMRKAIGSLFITEDFTVSLVDNGVDCINKARELRPDLVVADCSMPGKSGYEVAEILKSDGGTASIPVLLLGGTFEPFDEPRAKASGASSYLMKPFDSTTFLDRVKGMVGMAANSTVGSSYTPGAPVAAPAAPAPVAAPVPAAPMAAAPGMPPRPMGAPGMPPPGMGGPGMAPPGMAAGMPPRPPGAPMPGMPRPPGASMPGMPQRPPMGAPGMPAAPQGMAPGMPPRPMGAPGMPPPGMAGPGMPRPMPGQMAPPGGMPMRPPMGAPGMPPQGMAPGMRPPGAMPGQMGPPPGGMPMRPPMGPPGAPPPGMMPPSAPGQRRDPFGLGTAAQTRPAMKAFQAPSFDDPASTLDMTSEDAPPRPAAQARAADGGEALLRDALSKASKEVIEKIAWEVVPQLAETIIREELERLIKDRDSKGLA